MHIVCCYLCFLWGLFGVGCCYASQSQKGNDADQSRSRKIYESYCKQLKGQSFASTGELLVETARFFLGTPYAGGTLEKEPEQLVVNLEALDCMTLVENTVALAWSFKNKASFEEFLTVLRNLRYRGCPEELLEYTDRLHYTSDWIYENERKGYLKDMTYEIGGKPLMLSLSFMSTHPDSYKQLKGYSDRIARLAALEKEISARSYYFIPQDEIQAHAAQIHPGDIVCFVTIVKGLDISHVGIVCWENGQLTFIHASSTHKQVVVNADPLQKYVQDIKRNNGIMIVRPQF